MTKRLAYYFDIWLLLSKNSFLGYLQNRPGIVIFITGKILKFSFFAAFLYYLLQTTGTLVGYSLNQTLFFFLTFNIVDVTSQFLYREVYRFRAMLIDGSFDLVLTKPWSALFRALMGGADVFDLITLPPLILTTIYFGSTLHPTAIHVILYLLLIINALIIATAFHIFVISLGIITLEIDHTVMIYRDIVDLGRLPIEIYKEPLRGILTFLIPVGIMITYPAKVLMGIISPLSVIVSFAFGALTVYLSLRFWKFALKRYTSASS